MLNVVAKLRGRARPRDAASIPADRRLSKLAPAVDAAFWSAPKGLLSIRRHAGRTTNTTVVGANTTSHPETPAISLETLPPELRRRILFMTTDLEELRALVLASPVFYQQYLLDRKPLLIAALSTALGTSSLLAEACAVQISSSLYPPGVLNPDQRLAAGFMHEYLALRAATPATLLQQVSEADLVAMVYFYRCIVRPLVTECAARFLGNHSASPELGKVSATERTRFARALYRFQLYCNWFGPGPPGERLRVDLERAEILIRFFGLFRPWEVEEIDCLNHLFLQARGDATMMDKILLRTARDKSRNGAMSGLQRYMNQAGTVDIKQVLDYKTQAFRRLFHPLPGDQAEGRREVSRFIGDGEDGPPLAWAIMWQGMYSNRYGSLIPDSLKCWGYVFWDGERVLRTPVKDGLLQTWKAHLPVFRLLVGNRGWVGE